MEKFYIVTEENKLHEQYSQYQEYSQKIRKLFNEFGEEVGLEAELFCASTIGLFIKPTDNDFARFKKEFKKDDKNGFYLFKVASVTQKKWDEMLIKNDIKVLSKPELMFFFNVYGHMRSRLFSFNDTIYCSFESDIPFETPTGFTEIKGSEFYAVMEEINRLEGD